VGLLVAAGLAREAAVERNGPGEIAAVAHEEAVPAHPAGIVEPVAAPRDVVAGETRLRQPVPFPLRVARPLVAVERLASEPTVAVAEILKEGMGAGEVFVRLRPPEAGDEAPFPLLRGVEPGGVDRVPLPVG